MFDRVPWWHSAGVWTPLLAASLGVLVLTSLAWPISALTRRHHGVVSRLNATDARALRLVRFACVAGAAGFLAWILLMLSMTSDLELIAKLQGLVKPLHILSPVVFGAGTALGLWNGWAVLCSRRSWLAKLWAVLIAASFVVVLWAALAFHFISMREGF